jgi:hypothetical protein
MQRKTPRHVFRTVLVTLASVSITIALVGLLIIDVVFGRTRLGGRKPSGQTPDSLRWTRMISVATPPPVAQGSGSKKGNTGKRTLTGADVGEAQS